MKKPLSKLLSLYIVNICLAIDQLLNALLMGDPRETISSRAAKWRRRGNKLAYLLCRVLNIFQEHHCVKAEDVEVGENGVIPD